MKKNNIIKYERRVIMNFIDTIDGVTLDIFGEESLCSFSIKSFFSKIQNTTKKVFLAKSGKL